MQHAKPETDVMSDAVDDIRAGRLTSLAARLLAGPVAGFRAEHPTGLSAARAAAERRADQAVNRKTAAQKAA